MKKENVLVPTIVEKTSNGERAWDIFSLLTKERIIFMFNEVEENIAERIIAQLLYLDATDPGKDIYLYINSPGGSVNDGYAIYDTMQYIKSDVCTICIGMAASMGALLLSGGAKGKRFALPNAEIMIHQPLIHGGLSGQSTDIKIHADNLIKTREKTDMTLSKNTGQPIEKVREDTERDNYMSAEEAKKYGLIDRIISSVDDIQEKEEK